MSDYKLEFVLKQHTPIIHFQAKQKGATLRATELKPKLDRFLMEYFEKENKRRKESGEELIDYEKFLIAGQERAFDYKVNIAYQGKVDKYYIFSFLNNWQKKLLEKNKIHHISHSLYFAQENEYGGLFDKSDKSIKLPKLNDLSKYALLHNENLSLKIFSFHNDLLDSLKDNMHHFFAKENFGTRQNKGFGCFEVIKPIKNMTFDNILAENYTYIYKKTIQGDLNNVFKSMKEDYTHLKSGINLYLPNNNPPIDTYKKSLLFKYFSKDTNIRWEKRALKQIIHENIHKNRQLKTSNRNNTDPVSNAAGEQNWSDGNNQFNYQYIRVLLGLTDKYEFVTQENINDKYIVNLSNDVIDRFKSPITFKILKLNNGYNLYLCANEFDNTIFQDKNFLVSFKFKYSNQDDTSNIQINEWLNFSNSTENPFSLSVPRNFDIEDFLNYALINENNNEKLNNWSYVQGAQS